MIVVHTVCLQVDGNWMGLGVLKHDCHAHCVFAG